MSLYLFFFSASSFLPAPTLNNSILKPLDGAETLGGIRQRWRKEAASRVQSPRGLRSAFMWRAAQCRMSEPEQRKTLLWGAGAGRQVKGGGHSHGEGCPGWGTRAWAGGGKYPHKGGGQPSTGSQSPELVDWSWRHQRELMIVCELNIGRKDRSEQIHR